MNNKSLPLFKGHVCGRFGSQRPHRPGNWVKRRPVPGGGYSYFSYPLSSPNQIADVLRHCDDADAEWMLEPPGHRK